VGWGSGIAMSCDVVHGSYPMLRWLWLRPAAVAPVQSLAWELPCAMGEALIKAKTKFLMQFK